MAADASAAPGVDSACSTPFVSAPSSPTRGPSPAHGACFFSAPASPTRGAAKEFACLDFDFDFSSRFPSPSAAAMSSAEELFHNGQIRPVRLSAILLQPQPLQPLLDVSPTQAPEVDAGAEADERGRILSRSVRRKARSLSPFRTHRRVPSPAPAPESVEPAATPAASRSSSSSSSASSASSSSSSSRSSRRWGFLKELFHRSNSDGGKNHHHHPARPPFPSSSAAPKRNPSPSPSPAAARGRGTGRSRRRSAHERLYETRRAEVEDVRNNLDSYVCLQV